MLGIRVLIPKKFRAFILYELQQGHPGVVRTKELAKSYAWWPTIDNDIERFTASCVACGSNRNLPPIERLCILGHGLRALGRDRM